MKQVKVIFYLLCLSCLAVFFQNCGGEFSSLENEVLTAVETTVETTDQGSSSSSSQPEEIKEQAFEFNSIQVKDLSSETVSVYFETNDFSKAKIIYHEQENLLSQELNFDGHPEELFSTKGEHSLDLKIHKQKIDQLNPETIYYFKVVALNSQGQQIVSTLQQFKTNGIPLSVEEPPGDGQQQEKTPQESFWSEKGYRLFFSSTPDEQDMGKDPRQYFENKWNNGFPLNRYIAEDNLKMARAPDGSASAHISYKAGEFQTAASIVGNQFGPKGQEVQVVYSLETFFECIDGEVPKLYQYMGHGHHWGSEDYVNAMPGGSNNREDSWSLRIPVSKSGYYFTYAYIPDKEVVYGRSFLALSPKPSCGVWEKMELEIIQNTPVTAKNGIIRMYLNGKIIREQTGLQIRKRPTVRPKGLGYFVQQKNQNAKPLNIYHKNWKIYIR